MNLKLLGLLGGVILIILAVFPVAAQQTIPIDEPRLSEHLEKLIPQGKAMFERAFKAHRMAKTDDDLKKALFLYQNALSFCEQAKLTLMSGAAALNMAGIYQQMLRYEEAVKNYERALTLFKSISNSKGIQDSYFGLGATRSRQGQYAEAERIFEQLVQNGKEEKNPRLQGDALVNLGAVLLSQNKDDEALTVLLRAKEICQGIGSMDCLGKALHNMAAIYMDRGQYGKSKELFQESKEFAKRNNDLVWQCQSLHGLGSLHLDWNQLAEAEQCLEDCIGVLGQLTPRKPVLEAQVHTTMGDLRIRETKFEKAQDEYIKAVSVFRQARDFNAMSGALRKLSDLSLQKNKHDDALRYLDEALTTYRKIFNKNAEAEVLVQIGRVNFMRQDCERAQRAFMEVIDIRKQLGIAGKNLADFWNLLDAHLSCGKESEPDDRLADHLKHLDEFSGPKARGNWFELLGTYYTQRKRWEEGKRYYAMALIEWQRLDNKSAQAGTLKNLGTNCARTGDFSRANEFFQKALTFYEILDDKGGQSSALRALGDIHISWAQYEMAEKFLLQSLNLARPLPEAFLRGYTLSDLGKLYQRWGLYYKSEDCLLQALAVFMETKNHYDQKVLSERLGELYVGCGRYDDALVYFQKALDFDISTKDMNAQIGDRVNLGRVYAGQGDYRKAEAEYDEAKKLLVKMHRLTEEIDDIIVHLLMDAGRLDAAEEIVPKSLSYELKRRLCLIKAGCHMETLNHEEAKNRYMKILNTYEPSGNIHAAFTALTGLGIVCEDLGSNSEAEDYYRRAVNQVERERARLALNQRVGYFHVRVRDFLRIAPYEGLARVLFKSGKREEALKWSEYTKARCFSEAVSGKRGESLRDVPPQVLQEGNRLDDQIAELQRILAEGSRRSDPVGVKFTEGAIADLTEIRDRHIKMVREEYPSFAAIRYPKLTELKEARLKDVEWVLTYDVTDSGILIYLLHGKNLIEAWFEPCSRDKLFQIIRRLQESLDIDIAREKNKADFDSGELAVLRRAWDSFLGSFDLDSARDLGKLLLEKPLALLPANVPLIIIPDESLSLIPFEMLITNGGGEMRQGIECTEIHGATFLADLHPISYYSSIHALTIARKLFSDSARSKHGNKLLVIANPLVEGTESVRQSQSAESQMSIKNRESTKPLRQQWLERFSCPIDEMKKFPELLEKTYPNLVDRLLGENATKEALLRMTEQEPGLKQYGKIIFGCHGYFGNDLPGIMEPVLVLSLYPPDRDGFLRMSDVMKLNLNADLVALTACKSGVGRQVFGEGVLGMGFAFQHAGTRSVLHSLWTVRVNKSVELVSTFLEQLPTTMDKLQALSLARQKLRETGYNHPFFWASFILVGETGGKGRE